MNPLQQFIHDQQNLREMSLCIGRNSPPEVIAEQLRDAGYQSLSSVAEITAQGKYFIIITSQNIESVYALAGQYGSGYWGPLGERWVTPDYAHLSIVGIATVDQIELFGKHNIPLLGRVGMVIEQ